jgi:hypothetical protein
VKEAARLKAEKKTVTAFGVRILNILSSEFAIYDAVMDWLLYSNTSREPNPYSLSEINTFLTVLREGFHLEGVKRRGKKLDSSSSTSATSRVAPGLYGQPTTSVQLSIYNVADKPKGKSDDITDSTLDIGILTHLVERVSDILEVEQLRGRSDYVYVYGQVLSELILMLAKKKGFFFLIIIFTYCF